MAFLVVTVFISAKMNQVPKIIEFEGNLVTAVHQA